MLREIRDLKLCDWIFLSISYLAYLASLLLLTYVYTSWIHEMYSANFSVLSTHRYSWTLLIHPKRLLERCTYDSPFYRQASASDLIFLGDLQAAITYIILVSHNPVLGTRARRSPSNPSAKGGLRLGRRGQIAGLVPEYAGRVRGTLRSIR